MSSDERVLTWHLLRGGLAASFITAPAAFRHGIFLWCEVITLPLAIWMLRGCPLCWTLGLFQLVAERINRTNGDRLPRPQRNNGEVKTNGQSPIHSHKTTPDPAKQTYG